MIRQCHNKGDLVLFEGTNKPDYLPYSIRSQGKSWDLERSTEGKQLFASWNTLIYDVAYNLPVYLSLTLSATPATLKDNDSGIEVLIKDFYLDDGQNRFEQFKTMDQKERTAFIEIFSNVVFEPLSTPLVFP